MYHSQSKVSYPSIFSLTRKSRSQAIFIGTTSFLNYTLAFGVGILVFFVCYNRSYNSSLSLLFLWLSDPSDWRITNLSL